MKSGLEGRNNGGPHQESPRDEDVSMKSGLEGRNNVYDIAKPSTPRRAVSIKSGLEGRNNQTIETDFGKCNIMLSQ